MDKKIYMKLALEKKSEIMAAIREAYVECINQSYDYRSQVLVWGKNGAVTVENLEDGQVYDAEYIMVACFRGEPNDIIYEMAEEALKERTNQESLEENVPLSNLWQVNPTLYDQLIKNARNEYLILIAKEISDAVDNAWDRFISEIDC